jgi:hypothetical protein
MDTSQFATKQDLEDLYRRTEKMVGDVVGEIVGDALKLISARFDKVEKRLDRVELRLDKVEKRLGRVEIRLTRIEDKLDRTAAIVNLHAVDIRTLKRKTA